MKELSIGIGINGLYVSFFILSVSRDRYQVFMRSYGIGFYIGTLVVPLLKFKKNNNKT